MRRGLFAEVQQSLRGGTEFAAFVLRSSNGDGMNEQIEFPARR